MNALAKLYSWADGVKRRASNPLETIGLGITRAGEDLDAAAMDADVAYGRGGMKSVLLSKQQKAEAAKRAAQFGEQMAMAAATVWHGSPHKFDKFDSSKIGTGEGAQAYGHGLYLAESPDVAKTYRAMDGAFDYAPTSPAAAEQIKSATNFADRAAIGLRDALDTHGGDVTKAAKSLRIYAQQSTNPEYKAAYEKLAQIAESGGIASKPSGSLYKVDLPDSAIARMIDWDKPLSQQSKFVRTVAVPPSHRDAYKLGLQHAKQKVDYDAMPMAELERFVKMSDAEMAFYEAGKRKAPPPVVSEGYRYGKAPEGRSTNYAADRPEKGVSMAGVTDKRFDDDWEKSVSAMFIKPGREKNNYQGFVLPPAMRGSDGEPLMVGLKAPETGKEFYQRMVKLYGEEGAAKQLASRGIPGIRYLDGGSRGAGGGTSNFVVFPGNESLLTILERNGVPIK